MHHCIIASSQVGENCIIASLHHLHVGENCIIASLHHLQVGDIASLHHLANFTSWWSYSQPWSWVLRASFRTFCVRFLHFQIICIYFFLYHEIIFHQIYSRSIPNLIRDHRNGTYCPTAVKIWHRSVS